MMSSISLISSAVTSFPERAKCIQDPKVIIICALVGATLISLGISLTFLKQIPWNAATGMAAAGAFSGGISLAGLLGNRCRVRHIVAPPIVAAPSVAPQGRGQALVSSIIVPQGERHVMVPLMTDSQGEEEAVEEISEGQIPTLKKLCIQFLIRYPRLNQRHFGKLPRDLVEDMSKAITEPSQAEVNAHLFSGVFVEVIKLSSSKNLKIVKITEEFDNRFTSSILEAYFALDSGIFLISPRLTTRALKGFCQFIKNVEFSPRSLEISLSTSTQWRFFSDLTREEIKIFYENIALSSDEYFLFANGLAEVPEIPTLKNLREKIEKICDVSTIMLDHFRKIARDPKGSKYKKEYHMVEDWQEIIHVLRVISRCTLWARHFYFLSHELGLQDREGEGALFEFEYGNWDSYLKVEEIGLITLHYMEEALTELFSAIYPVPFEEQNEIAPYDLIEPFDASKNAQTKVIARLFSGISVEKFHISTEKFKVVRITEEFDHFFATSILKAHFMLGSALFLVSPHLPIRSLKALCQFIKDMQSSNLEISLTAPTQESFFSGLTHEEIKIFYENMRLDSDEYFLFIEGLVKVPETPTLKNLREKMEKICNVSTIMLDHFRKIARNQEGSGYKEEYQTIGDWQEVIEVLKVISRCVLWARHFYSLSLEIEKRSEGVKPSFKYPNWGSYLKAEEEPPFKYANWDWYLKVEEVGIITLHYMEEAIRKLFSAMSTEEDSQD